MSAGMTNNSAPVAIRRLATTSATFDADLQQLRFWSAEADADIETRVAAIVADVRLRGDAALLEYTARFDGVHASSAAALEIPAADLQAALQGLPQAQRQALQAAADRVRSYHQRQLNACGRSWQYRDAEGSLLGQKVTPLDRVGIYVPGGKASYPSSVLMNALPAQVAGVGEIIMVVPTPQGQRNALVLAAACVAGVHRVFTVGGAQAVAALAYGTATIPAVDKITGPGNAYVASAKRRVFGQVGIDMIAGPSEILVLADGTTPPDWVAMDLFSQAEHDELAQSILLCPDAAYIDAVFEAINRLLPSMPRQAIIRASLAGRGALIHTRSLQEACSICNRLAPEHLEVSTQNPGQWQPLLKHAGAIFLGAYTSESLGDYCAGPNHVLPTVGTARFSSPLGVYDFQKRSSLIEVTAAGAQVLGPIAVELALGEGLQAHAQAAQMRLAPQGASPASESANAFSVRAVTSANCSALMDLQVAPEQTQFVASVTRSLAQAAYEPASTPWGVYRGDTPVGFVLLIDSRQLKPEDDPHPDQPRLYVWRLLIDARHQRSGLGQQVLAWVAVQARAMGLPQVGLSHVMAPGSAGPFYEKQGFVYTGAVDEDGEHQMVWHLNPTAEGSQP
jgi:histidinol dehydrogenase